MCSGLLWFPCFFRLAAPEQGSPHAEWQKYSFPDQIKTKRRNCYMRRLIECTTGHNNLNYLQSKIYPEDVSERHNCVDFAKKNQNHLTTYSMNVPASNRGQVWHPPQPTNHQHTKMGLRRHNSILPHTFYWWSHDFWITSDQLTRFGPGLGGTPLPSILGTWIESIAGMPLCLSYREGWMPALLEEWETGTS